MPGAPLRTRRVRARAAQKFQVTSTPTFFVNGKMLRGSPTLEELTKQLTYAMSQKGPYLIDVVM